jgi:hypothetical protein
MRFVTGALQRVSEEWYSISIEGIVEVCVK